MTRNRKPRMNTGVLVALVGLAVVGVSLLVAVVVTLIGAEVGNPVRTVAGYFGALGLLMIVVGGLVGFIAWVVRRESRRAI